MTIHTNGNVWLRMKSSVWAGDAAPNVITLGCQVKSLTSDEFKATFGQGMTDVSDDPTVGGVGLIDIWPYVLSIPDRDWLLHKQFDQLVDKVYRNDQYDHVLVMTRTANVFMAIVVDHKGSSILGHHLLDLNKEYGIE